MEPNKEIIGSVGLSQIIPPGDFIRGALEERGITQKELSSMIGKSAPVINDIIKGKRCINAEIAILLDAVTGIQAQEWLDVQTQYDIQKAYQDDGLTSRCKKIRDWMQMKDIINMSILRKKIGLKGGLDDVDMLLAYAGVDSVPAFCQAPASQAAKFRKSEKLATDFCNLFTWTLIAKHESAEISLDHSYSSSRTEALVDELNDIFYENQNTQDRVKETLGKYGIKYIHLRNFEKTPVDGYSFWTGENPTIVVTCRYDRLDNYAFNIMHELGHIVKHLSPNSQNDFIESDAYEESSAEKEANLFAQKQLWRGASLERLFAAWSHPFAAANFLKKISENYHINIGIVTGQYQKYCSNYTICRNLLEKTH